MTSCWTGGRNGDGDAAGNLPQGVAPAHLLHNYAKFAEDAAPESLGYDRFLLALAEQEVRQREENRRQRRIRGARFPVHKELADFDFSCVSSLSKQRVLKLARGTYIDKAEPVILVGNPGLGKTHVATGLALAACRQVHLLTPLGAIASRGE
jgi:DNA replication protein DnaC